MTNCLSYYESVTDINSAFVVDQQEEKKPERPFGPTRARTG